MKLKKTVVLFLVTSIILNFAGCARQGESMLQKEHGATKETSSEEDSEEENYLPDQSSKEESPIDERLIKDTFSEEEISQPEISSGEAGPQKDSTYYQAKYGKYLEHFFLLFSQEFSSVSQLSQETVLFFTLVEMIDEYPQTEIPFEYDQDLDVYYIPRSALNEKVEQYFGIYDFDFVDTDRYSPEKDSYTYTFAHGYPILYPKIISTEIQRERIVFEVAYTNPEMEGNPTIQTLLFTFKEIENNGKTCLQAISANSTSK